MMLKPNQDFKILKNMFYIINIQHYYIIHLVECIKLSNLNSSCFYARTFERVTPSKNPGIYKYVFFYYVSIFVIWRIKIKYKTFR